MAYKAWFITIVARVQRSKVNMSNAGISPLFLLFYDASNPLKTAYVSHRLNISHGETLHVAIDGGS